MENKKVKFIQKLKEIPNVSKAALAAGMNRQYAYDLRKLDTEFASAWDEAIEMSTDEAEAEAYRRAVKGTLRPVFHLGKNVGETQEYSDTLLIFLLKAHRPEKYRDVMKVTGTGDHGEIEHTVQATVSIYVPDNGRDKTTA